MSVLNFGPTNRAISDYASTILSERVGEKVNIGILQVGMFNRLILRDIKVYDKRNQALLKAKLMTAKIELRSLFREQLSLRTISLLDADIRLYKQSPNLPANFQFLIDTFANDNSKENSRTNLRINSLILRRVNVSYDEYFKPETPALLNLSHLHLTDINANISLKEFTNDSLRLNVRAFSFNEKCGFALQNLRFRLKANRTCARLDDLEIILNHSRLQIPELTATYDAITSKGKWFSTLRTAGSLHDAQISTADACAFIKIPKDFALSAKVSTDFRITPRCFSLSNLRINDDDDQLKIAADAAAGHTEGKFTKINVQLEEMCVSPSLSAHIVKSFSSDTTAVNVAHRLGKISLSGNGQYHADGHGAAHLNLQCDAGMLHISARIREHLFNADMTVTNAKPAYLSGNPRLPALISLSGNIRGKETRLAPDSFEWKFDVTNILWNNYKFQSLHTAGIFSANTIKAHIWSKDPNALFDLSTRIALSGHRPDKLDLCAAVDRIIPGNINLKTPLGNAAFKGKIETKLSHLTTKPAGSLRITDFEMTGASRGDYRLHELNTQFTTQSNGTSTLLIHSDFLDAKIHGPSSVQRLLNGIYAIANRSLPGLTIKPVIATDAHDEWKFRANLKDTEVLRKMLGVDIDLAGGLQINGILNAHDGRTSVALNTDGIQAGEILLGKTSLYLNGRGTAYECLMQTSKQFGARQIALAATLQAADSTLRTQINWQDKAGNRYNGSFKSTTRFMPNPREVNFSMDIHPTLFDLDGAQWHISSGRLSLLNRELAFHNVKISREDQWLTVDGRIAPHRNDSIVAHLHRIDVGYVLDLVNFHAVDFGGPATGDAVFTQSGQYPELHAKLNIPDFTFNGGPMGTADIVGSWNKHDNRILLNADMRLPLADSAGTKVDGYVSLAEKGLGLNIHANRTNLQFLRRYMDGIFTDFDGEATGSVKLYGPFKQLDFVGQLKADATAGIAATGVKYHVHGGDVILTPGEFAFRNFQIDDFRQGSGSADGYLRHQHLKNLTYQFGISTHNLRCYDMPQTHDMPFYSTATGTGSVFLQGRPGYFTADIALRPTSPTTLVYTLGTPDATSTSNSMIHFHDAEFTRTDTSAKSGFISDNAGNGSTTNAESETPESNTDIVINFLIDTNPSAEVKIITDPKSGDAITAYGEGPIRATFHNKGNFEMYGTYKIMRGSYKFSLQDVIRKDLTLKQGSTITFGGVPLLADLGLKAVYTVNGVSLSDLNYGAGFSQKSVRVDCILNIGGKAKSPQVNFDLDFHNISEDEKHMVKQLISTEEDINRQVIYLLGIGRFYTANAQSADGMVNGQQQSTSAMRSFLSTTLTSQLNQAISSALGAGSHWSFGTNVATGNYGWNDFEVDGLLQGRLFNDRLLINGNFGYRDRPTYTSNFVGDFDVQYLLTPRGSVSLKAYSETSDRYFTKSSLTTQGVGIIFQREFNNMRDLFNVRKRKRKPHP